jgi:hypothetical protein
MDNSSYIEFGGNRTFLAARWPFLLISSKHFLNLA